MKRKLLITGGAGFIGTSITRKMAGQDYDITLLDNFNSQIHSGEFNEFEGHDHVKMIKGDVRNKELMYGLLAEQDEVIHLAAETGTGQSMYQITHYSDVNITATAIICEFLINEKHHIKRVVVASSRAIYGEGKYQCGNCGIVFPAERTYATLDKANYNPICPSCGKTTDLHSVPTDEHSKIHPASIYGLTKQVQEQMLLMTCRMAGITAFALRYQNVYGPGQSLINPYTGILAIFAKQAFFNKDINIFEDGLESRDFVFIDDVVAATVGCLQKEELEGQYSLNVGSGETVTVMQVAEEAIRFFNSTSKIYISGAFREGDIRHNVADISLITKLIGYQPSWTFAKGITAFLEWAAQREEMKIPSTYTESIKELEKRKLYKS